MQLTDQQVQALRQLMQAKGDALEMAIFQGLKGKRVPEAAAREAARTCSNRIWRNGMVTGAAAGIILGTMFTPVVGGTAGPALGAFAAVRTFTDSNACAEARGIDLVQAVQQLGRGL